MTRQRHLLLFFLFLFCANILVAQKETYTWPFGYKRMLTFHGGQMQYVDSINTLVRYTKHSSISDCAGSLLFYSDGGLIKNSTNDTIVNGQLPHPTAALNNCFLKSSISDSIYYLYSSYVSGGNPNFEDSSIIMSVINKNGGQGKGELISYQKQIIDSLNPNNFTLISNANDSSYWLVKTSFLANSMYSYSIIDTGIALSPTITSNFINLNDVIVSTNDIFKYSPTGNKLVKSWRLMPLIANNYTGTHQGLKYGFNLFNFNRSTGQVTFDRYIQLPDLGVENAPSPLPRGLTAFEFSPNERYLYCFYNRYSVLWQIDLSLPANHPFAYQYISMPQTDPNKLIFGKPLKVGDEQREDMLISPYLTSLYSPFVEDAEMFYSVNDSVFLSEIAAPNNPLSFAGFTYKKLFLGLNFGPSVVRNYLPHFPQGLTKTVIYSSSCTGDTIQFEVSSLVGVDSLHWHFGDSASGSNNTSNSFNPSHAFLTPGPYQITTTVFRSGGCTDSILTQFYAQEQPNFVLPPDTFFCAGDTLNISAINPPVASYRWLDTLLFGYQRNIYDSGTYILESFNDCGMDKDTFVVYKIPQPNPNLGTDTTICFGDTLYFDKTQNYTQTIWQDGDSLPQKMVTATDSLVWLESSNICGVLRDSLLVDFHLAQKPDLGTDTAICLQDTLQFSVNFEYDSLIWNTQNKADTFFSSQGKVVAELYNVCGYFTDTINIDTLIPLPPKPKLPAVVSICIGDSVTLSVNDTLSQYLWNTGAITPAIVVDTSGNYKVRVSNICGIDSAEITVELHQPLSINLKTDTGICQGIPYQITVPLAPISYDSVIWNGWIKSPMVLGLSGQYTVAVYNACGSYFDTTVVNRISSPIAQLSNDTTICANDTIELKNKTNTKYNTYLWSNGAQTDSITINKPQTYFVTVTNSCGFDVDSMVLQTFTEPQLQLPSDTIICFGNKVKLYNLADSNQTLVWSTGDTNTLINVEQPGVYIANLTHNCGVETDTFLVEVDLPLKSPFNQTTKMFCENDTLYFKADTNARTILWSTGLNQPEISITSPQLLTLTQTNTCENRADSILLTNYPKPKTISENYPLCPNLTLEVKINQPLIQVLWADQSTTNIKQFSSPTQTDLVLYNQCRDTIKQAINILQETIKDSLLFENGWLSANYTKGANYRWILDGLLINTENVTTILPQQPGLYQLFFLDEYNCERSQVAYIAEDLIATCENWSIYPNPVKNQINLFIPGQTLQAIKIMDTNGKLIYNQVYKGGADGYYFTLPINLSSGVYFFRVELDGCSKTQRIVVEK